MIVDTEDPANKDTEVVWFPSLLAAGSHMGTLSSTDVADQLFMDDKEEQLVRKATMMKSNWCTLLALISSAYLFFLPS